MKTLLKYLLCLVRGIRKPGKQAYVSLRAEVIGGAGIRLGFRAEISRFSRVIVDDVRSRIELGDQTTVYPHAYLQTHGGWIRLGSRCTVHPYSVLYGHGGLEIGDDVRIAPGVKIIPMNHLYDDLTRPIWRQGISAKGIRIGNDVWIGAGAVILDGVEIGSGAVIGAGSVVTHNVESFHVVAGSPARMIKKRK